VNNPDKDRSPADRHVSVLLRESIDLLAPTSDGRYCDATLGAGGHTEAILESSSPGGQVLGLDRDGNAIEIAKKRLKRFDGRVQFAHTAFSNIAAAIASVGWPTVDGVVADIGLSSMHVDEAERGFSFRNAGPVDMRMDTRQSETALDMIDRLPEADLADLIYKYGEERNSRRIAKRIKTYFREISSTADLARIIEGAFPKSVSKSWSKPSSSSKKRVLRSGASKGRAGRKLRTTSRVHVATRTFQALRIAVNDELGELKQLLSSLMDILSPGGRAVLITFHSLEDRIVKEQFRHWALPPRLQRHPAHLGSSIAAVGRGPGEDESYGEGRSGAAFSPVARLLNKKVIRASDDELKRNPRARSATLRAMQKV